MTSTQFIKDAAAKLGRTQKEVKAFVDEIETVIKDKVANGESFKVCDVNFSAKDVPAHTARNPRTGDAVDVPATKKIVLKAASDLKLCAKGA